MECNKTAGSDGLPAEFYRTFWNDISVHLLNTLNYAYLCTQLSVSQKLGIVKLFPKKDTEPYFVKNLRPISLLNCVYRIAAKAIANRLKHVLPKLIDSDQTGFLKGRFIDENIRLIDATINYTASKNIPGLLLSLISKRLLTHWNGLLYRKHFNFGPTINNWIKMFYKGTESCILNNGWSSGFFELERGVRKGCPLSPYLFILCVEILAEAIRKNSEIKGITVNGRELKISQYADDTTLILDGHTRSFDTSLKVLDMFSEISGLCLNRKKLKLCGLVQKQVARINCALKPT